MNRILPLLFAALPLWTFAQQLPSYFSSQAPVFNQPATIGKQAQTRLSSFVQVPYAAYGLNIEQRMNIGTSQIMGIGAGYYHQFNEFSRVSNYSLAVARHWKTSTVSVSAAAGINYHKRQSLLPYEIYFRNQYLTFSAGLNLQYKKLSFDFMTEIDPNYSFGQEHIGLPQVYSNLAYQFEWKGVTIEPSMKNYLVGRFVGHDFNLVTRYKRVITGGGTTLAAQGIFVRPMLGYQNEKLGIRYALNFAIQQVNYEFVPIPKTNHEVSVSFNLFNPDSKALQRLL